MQGFLGIVTAGAPIGGRVALAAPREGAPAAQAAPHPATEAATYPEGRIGIRWALLTTTARSQNVIEPH
jgi:hypothetical protein